MLWIIVGMGLLIGYGRWQQKQRRGMLTIAHVNRMGSWYPSCHVLINRAGLWMQYQESIWTIPWVQVQEALSQADRWTLHLQSGEVVSLQWTDQPPPLGHWWR